MLTIKRTRTMRILGSCFILLLLVTAVFLLSSPEAGAATVGDLHFKLTSDSEGYYVSYCDSDAVGALTIPATWGKKPVVSIANYAFQSCTGLTSVSIPGTVTVIGDYAFSKCTGLTSVSIPGSVTYIGVSAFAGCTGLTAATVPGGPVSIGRGLFSGCTGLTSVTIPAGSTRIPDGVFSGCTGLTSVTIPGSITTIGGGAFRNCTGLTAITIPGSVTTIGDSAFDGCTGLTSITIPESVTAIGGGAFNDCTGLTGVYITDLAAWCKIEMDSAQANPLYCANNLYVQDQLVTELVIPDGTSCVGQYAFCNATCLTSVTIPDSVTDIGLSAFQGCLRLEAMTVPFAGTCKTWEADKRWYAFGGLFEYSRYGVSGCVFVDTLCYENGQFYNYEGGYYIPASLKSVTVTGGYVHSYSFDKCTMLTQVILGDKVTGVGTYAFHGCTGLTSVTVGNSVTTIGDYAFDGCKKLSSLTLGNSVTTIGDHAFYSCSSLAAASIPDSVTTIGGAAFYGCSSMTSVTLGSSLTSIGDSAFSRCSGLTTVTVPDSVTTIGDSAFYSCAGLTAITVPNSLTTLESRTFAGCSNLTSVTVPDSVTAIGDYTFSGCYKLAEITIGEGVRSIGQNAFYDCTRLKTVTIPDSVTAIGNGAFKECTGLTTVYMGNGITSIDTGAFHTSISLRNVYYNGTEAQWNAITVIGNNNYLLKATKHFLPTEPELTQQPASVAASEGKKVQFSVALNMPASAYRWQYSKDGGKTWYASSSSTAGYNTDTLTVAATMARNGFLYRCKITVGQDRVLYSDAARLTVREYTFSFSAHPAAETVKLGNRSAFTVEVDCEVTAYQWQYQMVENGPWWNCTQYTMGYNTPTLNVIAAEKREGFLYRCRVIDATGKKHYSDPAELTVDIPAAYAVLSQPKDAHVIPGSKTTFHVDTQGEGLTYQWEYHKGVGQSGSQYYWITMGSTTGCKTDTLTIAGISGSTNRDGWAYRCVVTDPNGYIYTTDYAFLHVTAAQITAQPEGVTAAAGSKAVFTVEAEGEIASYQWQYTKDGGKSWYNSSSATQGYNTDTLTVGATAARNGFLYRCVLIDADGNRIESDAVQLTVQ